MNCQELNRMLETTDPDQRSAAVQAAIERHFDSCETCRGVWTSFAEIESEQIPEIPPELHARIDQLIAARLPTRPRAIRRGLIGGSLLVLGAAAATLVLQVGNREPELASTPAPPPSATPSLPSSAISDSSLAGTRPVDAAGGIEADPATDAAAIPASYALDPRSLVVIAEIGAHADAEASAIFDECHRGVVARLRALSGLNVIAGAAVTAFQNTGMKTEQIARELGAGSVLVVGTQVQCSALLWDSRSGAFITGQGLDYGAEELDWEHFYRRLALQVSDALLVDDAALLADAQATFLNTVLGEDERLIALSRAQSAAGYVPDEFFSDAAIAAVVQMMTTSADLEHRRSAVLMVRAVHDEGLIDPLLHALNHDPETAVRTAAASVLHQYVAEPRVRDALARVVADDIDDDPSVICCQGGLGETARRALASDDELHTLTLEQLMNPDLTDFQRLQPLVDFPDRGLMYGYGPDETESGVVFSIGRNSGDATVRSRAWSVLERGTRSPAFVPTLLDDLSAHDDASVRHAAARVLVHYADDADVRAALERALQSDACDCLSSILEPVLQAE